MRRHGDRIDVLADMRALQDPLYASRGIGSHAAFLLETLRERGADRLRLVGLVDPALPAPARDHAAACDEIRGAFVAGPSADAVFLSLSPMTHDTRLPARLLDRRGIRSAAVVYDFIPVEFPDRYLGSRQSLHRYAAASVWLPAHEAFFPISHHAAEQLTRRHDVHPDRITVTGVALREAFTRRLADGITRRPRGAADESILFIGGPDERKNLDAAVAAYRALRAAGRGRLQLVVAGGYPDDWRRRVLDACRGDAHGILFLDHITDEELADWHGHARATVIASRAEGFSLPVIEGIAAGGLVLASDIPVHRELLADPDVRFEPDGHDRLAAMLGRLLDSPADRARLAVAERSVATRFTGEAVAERFWEAFSRRFVPPAARAPTAGPRRRSIALVTPFPPDRTGVADYSLRCIEALARHVDVDVYTDQAAPLDTPAVREFHPISAAAWLRPDYDATIAVVGNSSFHTGIIDLHRRFGGPVIVHDNRLAELTAWWKGADHLRVLAERALGRGVGADEVAGWLADPGSLPTLFYDEIIDAARPLFVHSRGIQEHVRRLYHVEAEYLPFCVYRSFTAAEISAEARVAARRSLGIPDDETMIVSLGIVDAVKAPDVCVDAIAGLERLGHRARLHFVGECGAGARAALERRATAAGVGGRVAFSATWLDDAAYRRYLVAADAGVQLRGHFFGGLSGALLDCVAAGLPTVANDDLAAALEAPDYVARVPDRPAAAAVAAGLAACLGRGPDRSRHEAVRREFVATHGFDAYARRLLDVVDGKRQETSPGPAARVIATGDDPPPRIFVDASYSASAPGHSGVARVVGRTWEAIRGRADRTGCEVQRVAALDGRFVMLDEAASPTGTVPRFRAGDILLLPDAYWAFPGVWPAVEKARAAGATSVPLVYDLIPMRHPEIYGTDGARMFRRHLDAVMRHADLVVTISESVAVELEAATHTDRFLRSGPAIMPWRLGCDIPAATGGVRDGVAKLFRDRGPDSAYLVLGAIEPRKNHAFILEAFRRLWSDPATSHVRLAVVGRPGHGAAPILAALRRDQRFGDRLVLLDDCDDAEVGHAYRHARGLVFASIAEGFGLPIVEALRHGQQVFASDLPIHREVGGDDCEYFPLDRSDALADAIGHHERRHAGRAAAPRAVREPLTWDAAAERLIDGILARRTADAGVRGPDAAHRHAG